MVAGRKMNRQRSLKRGILGFFTLAAALLVFLSLVLTDLYFRLMKEDISRRDLALTRSISTGISSALDHHGAEQLRLSEEIAATGPGDSRVLGPMARFLEAHPQITWISLLDRDGVPIRTVPENAGMDACELSRRSLFSYRPEREDLFWSEPFTFTETGRASIILSKEEQGYTVTSQLDLHDLFSGLVLSRDLSKAATFALTDSSGKILEYSDEGRWTALPGVREQDLLLRILSGTEASFQGSLDGRKGLISVSPVKGAGWGILLFQPFMGMFHPPETLRNMGFMILTGILLSAFFITRMVTAKVLKQIQQVIDQTTRVSKGEYKVSIKPLYRELKELAEGFNAMARSIQTREEELRTSEARYRTLFHSNPIPVFLFDIESSEILDVNQTAISDYHYSRDEFLRMRTTDLLSSGADNDALFRSLPLCPTSNMDTGIWEHRRKDGSVFHVDITSHDLLFDGRNVRMAICKDITTRVEAEEALCANKERLRATLESIGDSIVIIDRDMKITWCNHQAERVFGLQEGDICHRALHRSDTPCGNCMLSRALREGMFRQREEVLETKEGCKRTYLVTSAPMYDPSGDVSSVVKSFKDIHDLKESERLAHKSLVEKEALLKEVHHRVKNNLQAVSGLLNIQSGFSGDLWTRKILKDSQNRVLAMAIIHEKLYRIGDIKRIDMGDYLGGLVGRLCPVYGTGKTGIRVEIHCDSVFLNIDTAFPVGLIVTELLSNSYKHAFPNNEDGRIRLELKEKESSEFVLIHEDNGIGLPGGILIEKPETLGLSLVQSYVEALGGTMRTEDDHGIQHIITFKEYHECPVEEL